MTADEELAMNKRHAIPEQQAAFAPAPVAASTPAIASIDQPERGANDTDMEATVRLKSVDVLAQVMLHSCLGG
jgi:hypothetical protein